MKRCHGLLGSQRLGRLPRYGVNMYRTSGRGGTRGTFSPVSRDSNPSFDGFVVRRRLTLVSYETDWPSCGRSGAWHKTQHARSDGPRFAGLWPNGRQLPASLAWDPIECWLLHPHGRRADTGTARVGSIRRQRARRQPSDGSPDATRAAAPSGATALGQARNQSPRWGLRLGPLCLPRRAVVRPGDYPARSGCL